jgi:hypothetical protein
MNRKENEKKRRGEGRRGGRQYEGDVEGCRVI